MDHAESIAQQLVEAVVVGSRMEYRVDQSGGQHDFHLHNPDGSLAAVEVTSSVDQVLEQTYARLRNTRNGGATVKTKLCKKDWMVHPALVADPRRLRSSVDRYLADIEAEGIDRFWGPTDVNSPSVERIYRDLAVISGSVFPHWKEPGQIGIALPSRGGAFKKAGAAVEAGEKEAFKDDNRKKLGASGATERHLVVYVFLTNYEPWCALVDCDPPAEPPRLPPEVTDLWLFSEARSANEYRVWRGRASSPWSCQTLRLHTEGKRGKGI